MLEGATDMGIVTVSREFGSGGREVGKRLADALGYAYYDREIVVEIADKMKMDEGYVANALEGGMFRNVPIHFGRTFSYTAPVVNNTTGLFVEQHKILKKLAQEGNCVIVGRAADSILAEHRPFNLFVHADMEAKMARCRQRAPEGESLTDRELRRRIKKIDSERARYHELFSDTRWGNKEGYHMCLNTTGVEIKVLIPALAEYIRSWEKAGK